MNPDLKVESHIMNPKRLESLLLKDQPIVPPDSVIKTFPNLKGNQVDIVLAQDKDGLAPSSFILRRGDWAKFFLDTWFDPLYRSYNFQKAETHALVRYSLAFARTLTNFSPGTYCSVASYNPLEIGPGPRANNERTWESARCRQ